MENPNAQSGAVPVEVGAAETETDNSIGIGIHLESIEPNHADHADPTRPLTTVIQNQSLDTKLWNAYWNCKLLEFTCREPRSAQSQWVGCLSGE